MWQVIGQHASLCCSHAKKDSWFALELPKGMWSRPPPPLLLLSSSTPPLSSAPPPLLLQKSIHVDAYVLVERVHFFSGGGEEEERGGVEEERRRREEERRRGTHTHSYICLNRQWLKRREHRLRAETYSLRHGFNSGANALRNWELQARNLLALLVQKYTF